HLTLRPSPRPSLSPYATLFRSQRPPRGPRTPRPYAAPPIARWTTAPIPRGSSAYGARPSADHDATGPGPPRGSERLGATFQPRIDRKSTRLNSSHVSISYAVFC